MAIKNFHNRLKEEGPKVAQLKSPELAEDFDLVDFDDRQRPIESRRDNNKTEAKLRPQIQETDFDKVPARQGPSTPGFIPNPVQSQPKPSSIIVQTKSEHSSNVDHSSFKPSSNLVQSSRTPDLNEVTGKKLDADTTKTQKAEVPLQTDLTENRSTNNPVQTQLKPSANLAQTSSKPSPKESNINSNIVQSSSKPSSQHRARPRANLVQSSSELKPTVPFSSLSGVQRTLIEYIFENCKEARDSFTDSFTSSHLASVAKTTVNTVQSAIKRLIQKQLISRRDFRDGPGGWTSYWLADITHQEILNLENKGRLRANPVQTQLKLSSQPSAQPGSTSPSSSSDLNINKTTTEQSQVLDHKPLPSEWQEIDFSCLSSIGFREVHLRQIFESGKSTPEMVQESIYELEHDLKTGNHGMRSPLLVILKQLRSKGEPYTAITPGYVSDQVRYERKRLEELKRRQGEINSLKEEQERILSQAEAEKEDLAFQSWLKTKTEAELKALAGTFNPAFSSGQAMLKNAFKAEQEAIRTQVQQSLTRTQ